MLRELALSIPQYGDFEAPGGIPTGGLSTTGGKIIQTGIGLAFLFAIILCLFVIIWGGIQWISSGGDKQKLATARSRIIYAIVGLIIVLLSFVIVNLFTTFLGLPSPMSPNLFQNGQTPPAAESPARDAASERIEDADESAVVPPTAISFEVQSPVNLGDGVTIIIKHLPKAENAYTLRLTSPEGEIQFTTHADGTCTPASPSGTIPNLGSFCGDDGGDDIFQFIVVIDTNMLGFIHSNFPFILTLSGGTLEQPITSAFTVVNPNP